jgi:hypothetical protein
LEKFQGKVAPDGAPNVAPGSAAAPNGMGPTQAHIEFLRTNPDQARAFDMKFGEGAAAKYLGQ